MNEINGYFDDDGNPVDPELFPKPGLCIACKKDTDANEVILCNLNRLDQRNSDKFICYSYEKLD